MSGFSEKQLKNILSEGLGDQQDSSNYADYLKLPKNIKRRIKALKKLQYQTVEIDAEFYKRFFDLEQEFQSRHQNIFDKRAEIVKGSHEPNDEECDWHSDHEENGEELAGELKEKASITTESNNESFGIPNFWYKSLMHVAQIEAMIMEYDVAILKHLTDIKCILINDEKPGFILEFYFSENEWFTNQVLTKSYFFSFDISKEEPFDYNGPEIKASQGCVIKWNPGKNVTVKHIKKVQKHKGRNEKRTLTKTIEADSIFNFFNPDYQSIEDESADHELLECDFKIGQYLRESLIPRAVLFFTGEASDDEFDEDDDDYSVDEVDEGDDSNDEEDNDDGGKHSKHHHQKKGHTKKGINEDDCKQQ